MKTRAQSKIASRPPSATNNASSINKKKKAVTTAKADHKTLVKKNKVTSPAPPTKAPKKTARLPPKSPELRRKNSLSANRPPGEDRVQVASPSVSIGSSSGSRTGTPLPLNLQKQLARDIENSGGIKAFEGSDHTLAEVLNKREDLYGIRGSILRSRITKKVYRWQLLQRRGEYVEKVLNLFSVKSAIVQLKECQEQREDSSLSSSGSSSTSSESSVDSNSSSPDSIGHRTRNLLAPVEESIPIPSVVESNIGHKTPPPPPPPPQPPAPMSFKKSGRSPTSPSIPLPRDAGKSYRFLIHDLSF
jgi:hypothetical protein